MKQQDYETEIPGNYVSAFIIKQGDSTYKIRYFDKYSGLSHDHVGRFKTQEQAETAAEEVINNEN